MRAGGASVRPVCAGMHSDATWAVSAKRYFSRNVPSQLHFIEMQRYRRTGMKMLKNRSVKRRETLNTAEWQRGQARPCDETAARLGGSESFKVLFMSGSI